MPAMRTRRLAWFWAATMAACAGGVTPRDGSADDASVDAFTADRAAPDVNDAASSDDVPTCATPCGSTCCAGTDRCDTANGRCVECVATSDCAARDYCDLTTHTCDETFRVATYNILGAHFTDAGSPICLGMTGDACSSLRGRNTMAVIRGRAGFEAFDIVGVQEMEREQFIQIGQGLSGVDPAYRDESLKYDRHPQVVDANYLTDNIDDFARTIYWRRDRFDRVTSGRITYPTNDGTNVGVSRPSYAPWVQLRSRRTGRAFFVLNHHAAVTTVNQYRSTASALFREQTARIVTAWATDIQNRMHVPVIIMGDFNSTFVLRSTPPHDDDIAYAGNRARLPYCVMTASGVLANAQDAVAGLSGPCPTLVGAAVDHLYVTDDLHVEALVRVVKGNPATTPPTDLLSHASDHAPVYADIGIPPRP